MTRFIYYTFILLSSLMMLGGCKKELNDIRGNDGYPEAQVSELDKWLAAEFEIPYNIKVVYRQMPFKDPIALNNRSVELSRVKPVMKAYKKLWIDYLEKLFGKDFVRRYHPKEIRLYGAPNFDDRRVEDMDTPGLGTQIMPLYNVNVFDCTRSDAVYRLMREATFCFTKNMLELRPVDLREFSEYNIVKYNKWTENELQGEYSDRSDLMASFGYFTKAAQSGPVVDFAETMSLLLCQLPKNVNGLMKIDEYETPPPYKLVLQKKVAFIDKYLLENFGIKRLSDLSRVLPRMILQYPEKCMKGTSDNLVEP